MTRLLAVPLDASDVFLMTFMILQDSYMEPTRVGSDTCLICKKKNYMKWLHDTDAMVVVLSWVAVHQALVADGTVTDV